MIIIIIITIVITIVVLIAPARTFGAPTRDVPNRVVGVPFSELAPPLRGIAVPMLNVSLSNLARARSAPARDIHKRVLLWLCLGGLLAGALWQALPVLPGGMENRT